MKMTANRRLIIRRLEQGPATTRELREYTSHEQGVMHQMMQRMVKAGAVKNTGPHWRAQWELVK